MRGVVSGLAGTLQASRGQRRERSEIELSGFSGARVLLIREGDEPAFIRKISAVPAGNVRLQAQAVKQKLIAGLLDGCVTTPRILGDAHDEAGLYYFDMEYVRGQDGVTFLRTAGFPAVVRFADALSEAIERFATLKDQVLRVSPRESALAKCEEIHEKVAHIDVQAGRSVERLLQAVLTADVPDDLAVTACHGDMTLENLVVTADNRIVFIDLLDTFFDHWLGDVAKLEQDLKAGWYMRKSPPLPLGVVHYVRKRLLDLSDRLSADASRLLALFVCIHLARILPYAKTVEDRAFVLGRLDFLLTQLDAGSITKKGVSP